MYCTKILLLAGISCCLDRCFSLSPQPVFNRRALFRQAATAAAASGTAFLPRQEPALAAPADCYGDCFKNCKAIAPKDPQYCEEQCRDYCAQPDRTDGLSGSVSSATGEVGLLGGSLPGTGTVVKGEDKPPAIKIPGLDFTSGAGKKLLGY